MIVRLETLESVQAVLAKIDVICGMTPYEIGVLKWQAFAALTDLQADLRLKFEYGGAA